MAGDKIHGRAIRTIGHKEGPNVPAGGGARIRNSPPREPRSPSQRVSRAHNTHDTTGQETH
jgi:hypothetical protein